MNKEKVIKLFKDGEVKTNDRVFTRLVGGFGDDKPMFTIWQTGELLGLRTGDIREDFNRNESNFEQGIDFIDLKSANDSNVSQKVVDITIFLKNVGYSQSKLNATSNWLAFSYSGMMKLVKIATTKESWDIYDKFLEDYFKTKAENEVMKDSIEKEIKALIEDKATLLGKSILAKSETDRIEFARMVEDRNRRIILLEKTQSEKEIIAKVQDKINIADNLCTGKHDYDIGKFSKTLGIPKLGRNKLFEWMRDNRILDSNNIPYQKYMKYFSVANIPTGNGYVNYKTMIKPSGIGYLLKKLEKDGKLINKSINDILEELNKTA